jgi:hypothetical protein
MEIRGVIFDDAHLSLDLLDDQFSVRVEDDAVIKTITDIFKSSPHIKDQIESVQTRLTIPRLSHSIAMTMIRAK